MSVVRSWFRKRLKEGPAVVAPGVVDALSAKIAQQVGFEALYMTGFGVAATFGKPDLGLLSMIEVTERAGQIASAVGVPVIADADDGYGNVLNVMRAVKEFERAGVAAIQLEDQVYPKKCGSYSGKKVITTQEMCGKIKAVLDTRVDADFLVIARTDSAQSEGLDAAIHRSVQYAEAGADLVLALGYLTAADLQRFINEVPIPIMALKVERERTEKYGTPPPLKVAQLDAMGVRLVALPLSPMLCSAYALHNAYQAIKDGADENLRATMYSWEEMNELTGLPQLQLTEQQYMMPEVSSKP